MAASRTDYAFVKKAPRRRRRDGTGLVSLRRGKKREPCGSLFLCFSYESANEVDLNIAQLGFLGVRHLGVVVNGDLAVNDLGELSLILL